MVCKKELQSEKRRGEKVSRKSLNEKLVNSLLFIGSEHTWFHKLMECSFHHSKASSIHASMPITSSAALSVLLNVIWCNMWADSLLSSLNGMGSGLSLWIEIWKFFVHVVLEVVVEQSFWLSMVFEDYIQFHGKELRFEIKCELIETLLEAGIFAGFIFTYMGWQVKGF